jgi:hypothetical protein
LDYNPAMPSDLKPEIAAELEDARASRQAGNEGRARVCARRAAGMAAREFLARRGVPQGISAYQALIALAAMPGLPPDLADAADRLTLRVDAAFDLPVEVDLIAEAAGLIAALERTA